MKLKKVFFSLCFIFLTACSSTNAALVNGEGKAQVYYHYKTIDPYLCLTFDDGPDKTQTINVLNVLTKYNAKTTFFVLGEEVEYQRDILKKVYEAGHEIGNHFYKHDNISKMSKQSIKESIEKNNDLIESVIGVRPVLVRPPYGIVTNALKEACYELNMKIILWTDDKDSRDWNKTPESTIVKNLLAKPLNGDIFLFHDANKNRTNTISAIDIIIPSLQKKGFTFVTVSKLLAS